MIRCLYETASNRLNKGSLHLTSHTTAKGSLWVLSIPVLILITEILKTALVKHGSDFCGIRNQHRVQQCRHLLATALNGLTRKLTRDNVHNPTPLITDMGPVCAVLPAETAWPVAATRVRLPGRIT